MSHFLLWMESRAIKVDCCFTCPGVFGGHPAPRSVCHFQPWLPLIAVALVNVSHQGALDKAHQPRHKSKCKPSATDHRLFLCTLTHHGSIAADVPPQHGRCLHWSLTKAWVTVVTNADNTQASAPECNTVSLASHQSIWKSYTQQYHKGPNMPMWAAIQQRWNHVIIIQLQLLIFSEGVGLQTEESQKLNGLVKMARVDRLAISLECVEVLWLTSWRVCGNPAACSVQAVSLLHLFEHFSFKVQGMVTKELILSHTKFQECGWKCFLRPLLDCTEICVFLWACVTALPPLKLARSQSANTGHKWAATMVPFQMISISKYSSFVASFLATKAKSDNKTLIMYELRKSHIFTSNWHEMEHKKKSGSATFIFIIIWM